MLQPFLLLVVGYLWGVVLSVNKNFGSSSFVCRLFLYIPYRNRIFLKV